MASIDQFPLDAEIAFTELRSESTVTQRLGIHHRLRVRRRNELVGVLLDAQAWHSLVRHVERLEAELEEVENAELRSLLEARLPGATFESGSPALVDEIDHEYERIILEKSQPEA